MLRGATAAAIHAIDLKYENQNMMSQKLLSSIARGSTNQEQLGDYTTL